MNATKAFNMDSEFYSDFCPEHGYWYVFGDTTGFAYSEHISREMAEIAVEILSSRKETLSSHTQRADCKCLCGYVGAYIRHEHDRGWPECPACGMV